MSPLEVVGFVAGVLCVALAVRRHVWNYAWGVLSTAAFLVVFAQAGLYANAGLQAVFIALGLAGWWSWSRSGGDSRSVPVQSTRTADVVTAAVATGVLSVVIITMLQVLTDSVAPTWDGLTTASSLVAQYLLNRRIPLTWIWWIATDVVLIGLYASQGLHLTAVLYVVFLGLCVAGVRQWSNGEVERA